MTWEPCCSGNTKPPIEVSSIPVFSLFEAIAKPVKLSQGMLFQKAYKVAQSPIQRSTQHRDFSFSAGFHETEQHSEATARVFKGTK